MHFSVFTYIFRNHEFFIYRSDAIWMLSFLCKISKSIAYKKV